MTAVLVAVAAGVIGAPVSGLLVGGGFEDPHSDSSAVRADISAASGVDDRGVIVLVDLGDVLGSDQATRRIVAVVTLLHSDRDLALVADPLINQDPALISRDRRMVLVEGFWHPMSDADEKAAAQRLVDTFAHTDYVTLGGFTLAQTALEDQTTRDLTRAELIAFPILLVLLFLIFRSVVAALIPLLMAALAVLLTFTALRGIHTLTPLSVFALNTTTGLGLGLAIDAGLLMVSRFREELDTGADRGSAVATTLRTAGRTVLFSASTVAAAMASLLVFPQRFLFSMGIGGVVVTVCSATVALVVLPAVLAALGPNVDRLAWRPRALAGTGQGFWYRVARLVMRRPVLIALGTAAVLLVLASPARDLKLTYVGVHDLPAGTSVRAVGEQVTANFPAARFAATTVAVQAGQDAGPAVAAFARQISGTPGVSGTGEPKYLGSSTWRIDAVLNDTDSYGDNAVAAVRALRGLDTPLPFKVGGGTAVFVDLEDSLGHHLPLAFAIIAAAILLALFAATGSVVLPVKAVIMNMITLAATFGMLVAVFQWGWFAPLLGFTRQAGIETTEPVLIAIIAFGLSTDYGVFLLTRIKEVHDGGADTRDAVAQGLERTGRVVTAAALLFCVAVGSFATSGVVFLKEVGVGTAFAVLIDATIVRALLVPALMAILGQWNWWAPGPLRRLHHSMRLDRTETASGS